jgi:hypothetical protein
MALMPLKHFLALNKATPPPAIPSSTAARWREVHHQLCLFSSFLLQSSTNVVQQHHPANLAKLLQFFFVIIK